MRIHDAIILHHGDHETARERMPVHQGHGGHRVGEKAVPERVQALLPETWRVTGVLEVQAVGEEFLDARGCYHDAWFVLLFDDVQGEDDGLAEILHRHD